MKKVVKFGGSSLANAEQFQKVGDIIRSDESTHVMWYCPRREEIFRGDTKVTDLLYTLLWQSRSEERISRIVLTEIKGRFYEIIKGSNLEPVYLERGVRDRLQADFKAHAGNEYAASRGEFLNGKVMAALSGI